MQLHITENGYLAHWHSSLMARQLFLTCLALLFIKTTQSQTTLVGWNFEDKNAFADSGISTNLNSEITSTSPPTVNYVSGSGGAGSFSTNNINWDNGQGLKYWQISFSSQGYKNLAISSKQYSSNTGPRDFKIQYSLDGSIWADAGITITLAANFTKGVLNNIALPSACDDRPVINLRWTMSSNIGVNGSNVGATGSNRIDDILLTGCLMPMLTSPLAHSCCSGSSIGYTPEGSGTTYEWNRPTVEGISQTANAGTGSIDEVLSNTTNLPVEVAYTYQMNLNGCTNNQTVVVTVDPTPDLLVLPTSIVACPESGIQTINFSNPNQVAGTTFFWEWTGLHSDSLSISPLNGTSSPINISILNIVPSSLTETSLVITGTSLQGCFSNQTVTILSGDNTPPIFNGSIIDHTFCVLDIFEATCNGSDDILEPRPDYYSFESNDHSLDLDPALFNDNCTITSELILHWQIDIYQSPVPIFGLGQPSSILSPIVFSGDAENIVIHHITYWLEDMYGNMTPVGQRPIVTISVRPRPPIVQNF